MDALGELNWADKRAIRLGRMPQLMTDIAVMWRAREYTRRGGKRNCWSQTVTGPKVLHCNKRVSENIAWPSRGAVASANPVELKVSSDTNIYLNFA